jgi:hypothetical protein
VLGLKTDKRWAPPSPEFNFNESWSGCPAEGVAARWVMDLAFAIALNMPAGRVAPRAPPACWRLGCYAKIDRGSGARGLRVSFGGSRYAGIAR